MFFFPYLLCGCGCVSHLGAGVDLGHHLGTTGILVVGFEQQLAGLFVQCRRGVGVDQQAASGEASGGRERERDG